MKQLIFPRLSTTRSVVIITLIMTRSPGSNFLSLNVAIKILINCLNAGCAGKFIRKSSISALDSFSIKKLLCKVPQNASSVLICTITMFKVVESEKAYYRSLFQEYRSGSCLFGSSIPYELFRRIYDNIFSALLIQINMSKPKPK